jgi:4-diphosphocytidyl-2-C-methyl-D-erythritol kinase
LNEAPVSADGSADSGTGIARAAPAKINLYLHVTGRRADGYHLLDSLAVFAGIHDTIVARENDSLALSLSGPFGSALSASAGGESDNLVLRAAKLLRERAGAKAGAAITLVKRLPVASGIGGGSADAAATLLACDALWKTRVAKPDLAAMALQLGADVPICLHGRAAFFGGIGEEIADAPKLPQAFLILVNPGIPLSTAEVFRARKGSFGNAGRFSNAPKDAAGFAQILGTRRNDLSEAAIGLCPVLSQVLEALAGAKGCLLSRMSGSGATCFGLFATEAGAKDAAREIGAQQPRWWVTASALITDTRTLDPVLP